MLRVLSFLTALGIVTDLQAAVRVEYGYDDLGRLVLVERSDGPVIRYEYDVVGNLVGRTVLESPDSDSDGVADFADADDDGDELPDEWELAFGLNPRDATDALSDEDGDGLTALDEFRQGSDPGQYDAGSLTSSGVALRAVLVHRARAARRRADGGAGIDSSAQESTRFPPAYVSVGERADPPSTPAGSSGTPESTNAPLAVADTMPALMATPFWLFAVMLVLGARVFARRSLQGGVQMLLIATVLAVGPSGARAEGESSPVRIDAGSLEPGWAFASAEPVSPRLLLRSPGASGALAVPRTGVAAPVDEGASFAGSEIEADEFASMAEALGGDPLRIFLHVRNEYEYVPYFGALRGPLQTARVLEGNDFDLASLLVRLFRAAGYTARYRFGIAAVMRDDTEGIARLAGSLGADANVDRIVEVLSAGGVPVEAFEDRIEFSRLWVELEVDGQFVPLDPAFKGQARLDPVALPMTVESAISERLAGVGGVTETHSVRDLDADALHAALTSMSTELGRFLAEEHYDRTTTELVGGLAVVAEELAGLPAELPFSVVSSEAPWSEIPAEYYHAVRIRFGGIDATLTTREFAGRKLGIGVGIDAPAVEPPPAGSEVLDPVTQGTRGPVLRIPVRNQQPVPVLVVVGLAAQPEASYELVKSGPYLLPPGGYDEIWVRLSGIDQEPGRKNATLSVARTADGDTVETIEIGLTGIVNPPPRSLLRIDDVVVASGSLPVGTETELRVDVDHPYSAQEGAYMDQSVAFPLRTTGIYVLVSGFGADANGRALVEEQSRLDAMLGSSGAGTGAVLTQTLQVMGRSWMAQRDLYGRILAGLARTAMVTHHTFAILGQEDGYFIDVKAARTSVAALTATEGADGLEAGTLLASALEHGVLEQLQGVEVPSVSTTRLFALANAGGLRFFQADGSTFDEVVGQLSGYGASELLRFRELVGAGETLILPEIGSLTAGSWSGSAYIRYRNSGGNRTIGMLIEGDLYGGASTEAEFIDPESAGEEGAVQALESASVQPTFAADPVDMVSGAFVTQATDLVVPGEGAGGLEFSRSYNSQRVHRDPVGLGRGWDHSYDISIRRHSDAAVALGARRPGDAAAALVATAVLRSLMAAPDSPRDWVLGSLVAHWAVRQIRDRTVTVAFQNRSLSFQQQPDGAFLAPPGVAGSLDEPVAGTFRLEEPDGSELLFRDDGRIGTVTDANGGVLAFEYAESRLARVVDAYGRDFEFIYADDRLLAVRDFTDRTVVYAQDDGELVAVSGLEGAVWGYDYDDRYRITRILDPTGQVTVTNRYDVRGRVTEQIVPRDTGDERYRFGYGAMRAFEEDPLGVRTRYRFDAEGRLLETESGRSGRLRFAYDSRGNLVRFTDRNGISATVSWDRHGNPVQAADGLGNTTTLAYDEDGRFRRITDALGRWMEVAYEDGRPTSVTNSSGAQASVTYGSDGRLETLQSSGGVPARFEFDALGYPASGGLDGRTPVVIEYDPLGRRKRVVDSAGAVSTFEHDDRGLTLGATDPLGRRTMRIYDALGRPERLVARSGVALDIGYTRSGRVRALTYAGASIEFGYDARDDLTEIRDELGTTTHRYDEHRRIERTIDPHGFEIGYEYDADGRLRRLVYPGGRAVSYHYDEGGRLERTELDGLGLSTRRVHDEAGRLRQIDHFNGTTSTYAFDSDGRLAGIDHRTDLGLLVGYAFTTDERGFRRRVDVTNELLPPSALIDADQTMTFGEARNRLLASTENDAATFRTYDHDGNTTRIGATSLAYDPLGRLTQIGSSRFTYDGAGNRLRAERDGNVTYYVYDAWGRLLAQADSARRIVRYFVYGVGLLATVDARSDQVHVYHFDGTGHTVAITDAGQNVTHRYAYDPYGRILGRDEAFPQPFTFVGQLGVMRESEGLYYMRARYYDPRVGRFLSEDPIGFVGGLNLYAYANGNPVAFVDPDGTLPIGILLPIGGGLIGGSINALTTYYQQGEFNSDVALSFAQGFGAGAVGTLGSIGTGSIVRSSLYALGLKGGGASTIIRNSLSSLAAGAAGGAASDVLTQYFSGSNYDPESTLVSAVVGSGVRFNATSLFPMSGAVPDLFPRNQNLGSPNVRLFAYQVLASAAVYGGYKALFGSDGVLVK
jgi:RHS repeat-associated protein